MGWFSPEMDGLGPFVLLLMGNWLESGWEQVDNLPPAPQTLADLQQRSADTSTWPEGYRTWPVGYRRVGP